MHYLTAGESHGEKLVVIVDDVPSGITISEKDINFELKRRSTGPGRSSRQDNENNTCHIVSGVRDGRTTGNPVCVEVQNFQGDCKSNNFVVRPGHADLNGVIKYNFDDYKNVSERASARETVARVIAGVIAKNMLVEFDVEVYGYVTSIGSVSINVDETNLAQNLPDMSTIAMSEVMCPDTQASQKMVNQIQRAADAGDSLGGRLRIVAVGLVPGLGGYSQAYDRLNSRLAASVASVPSVREVGFGSSQFISENVGSAGIDQIEKVAEGGFARRTNFAGGLEGGMTNGMPLIISVKVRPCPTVKKPVKTIDLETMDEVSNVSDKRSDVCVVPNVAVVCESEVALTLANAYMDKFGHDSLSDIKFALHSYKHRINEMK